MKILIISTFVLLLNTYNSNSQTYKEPIWTHCFEENSYLYSSNGGSLKQVKQKIKFCYNNYAFGFTDGHKMEVFTIVDYRIDNMGGYYTEVFYNGESNAFAESDLMVFIVRSKPAEIWIQHPSEPKYAYCIKTKAIPATTIKLSPEYYIQDSIRKATAIIVKEATKRHSDSAYALRKFIDSFNYSQSVKRHNETEYQKKLNEENQYKTKPIEHDENLQQYKQHAKIGQHIADSMRNEHEIRNNINRKKQSKNILNYR
jgi:hypothetical protein